MTCNRALARIDRSALGGEYVLPCPLASGGRVPARERVREMHGAEAVDEIPAVRGARCRDLRAQPAAQSVWKHRDAVLRTFAVAHEDLAALEIDVLHAQAQRLHDAQAGAV